MMGGVVKVKICGITTIEDARCAVEAGADALGFVFAVSPRRVNVEVARAIIKGLPPFISKVGVFVNEESGRVEEIAHYVGLDTLQFHGDEPPDYCRLFDRLKVIKAFRMRSGGVDISMEVVRYKDSVDAFLLDTYVPGRIGGTGERFPWELALPLKEYGPLILAGGLTAENVGEAIRLLHPYGVDVSSGVEGDRKGIKDKRKVIEFISNVRRS